VNWSGTLAAGAPQGKTAPTAFPIVGVGASAGGLAATTEFLRHVGARPGAGIVIFHHLAPTHESGLVQILSRATSLPVQSADDGSRLEQNHVCMVPPKARLSIEGGAVNLTPRSDEMGLPLAIDSFFESLAEDRQHLAIGVVLSGSGSDGSAGVRAIKAVGGITFAQDESAEYRSMPESAVLIQKATERLAEAQRVRAEKALESSTRESGLLVVCFLTDVSARREAERRIVDYQEKLRKMSFDAALTEERERRRIAADLHDRIGQSLALSQMKLASMPRSGSERTAVDEAIELLAQSIIDTRTLIFDLSPPILYELGLKEALSWLAEDLGKRWGLEVELDADQTTKPLADTCAALVFRAVRELLTNVVKHARVSAAKVSLRRQGDAIQIDVEDRGVGFDSGTMHSDVGSGGQFGLFSVREQMSRLGGTVEIASGQQRGTRVSLRLPIQKQ
jgi:signal transduction histidine kinase